MSSDNENITFPAPINHIKKYLAEFAIYLQTHDHLQDYNYPKWRGLYESFKYVFIDNISEKTFKMVTYSLKHIFEFDQTLHTNWIWNGKDTINNPKTEKYMPYGLKDELFTFFKKHEDFDIKCHIRTLIEDFYEYKIQIIHKNYGLILCWVET